MHATVWYHPLIVLQVRHDVGPCVKSGSFSLSSLKCKVNGQYWWDILLSQQNMLAATTCSIFSPPRKKEQYQHQRKIILFLLSYGHNRPERHLLLVT